MQFEVNMNYMGYTKDGCLTSDSDVWILPDPTMLNIVVFQRDDENNLEDIVVDFDIPVEHSQLAYRLLPEVESYFLDLENCPPDMSAEAFLAEQYEADARAAALQDEDVF